MLSTARRIRSPHAPPRSVGSVIKGLEKGDDWMEEAKADVLDHGTVRDDAAETARERLGRS
jgi:hypothetical protein